MADFSIREFALRGEEIADGWGLRRVLIHDQEVRRFEDPELRVDFAGPVNIGVVAATSPLSATGWMPFHAGELLVLEAGEIRYSSHRDDLAVLGYEASAR